MCDPDQLEESLSCDDLFLQYFNAFLSLPAFAQRLQYDRLTGTFHELHDLQESGKANSASSSDRKVYAAREEEKERLLEWTRRNRLLKFYKSRFYRELKLCKLLLRPLDERRGSSRIRGYSRLSMVTTLTSYSTNDYGGTPELNREPHDETTLTWRKEDDVKFVSYGVGSPDTSRPASRTNSLPPNLHAHRTWSGRAVYDTSSLGQGEFLRHPAQAKNYRIKPNIDEREMQELQRIGRDALTRESQHSHWISDSGLGTTALDYATTQATSAKTRNLPTRADTLGVESRWESEQGTGYISKTPNEDVNHDNEDVPVDITSSRYRGKSALRTANSPSKHHRATIVLPSNKRNKLLNIGQQSSDDESAASGKSAGDDASEFDDLEYLEFSDTASSGDETETEIATMQKDHSTTLQHVKERALGHKCSMDDFMEFLCGTAGYKLAMFWLDVEAFKDVLVTLPERYSTMGEADSASLSKKESVARIWRHCMFRDILNRYKLTFTEEAKQQILEAQSNEIMGYEVFAQTQYDALRRLRSYWVPRYIVHCSRMPGFQEKIMSGSGPVSSSDNHYNNDFQRYIENYMPPLLSLETMAESTPLISASNDQIFDVTPLEAVAEEVEGKASIPSIPQIRNMSAETCRSGMLMRALIAEADAGYPYKDYLISVSNKNAINAYFFWMSCENLPCVLLPNQSSKTGPHMISSAHGLALYRDHFSRKTSKRFINLPTSMRKYERTLDNIFRKVASESKDSPPNLPINLFRPAKTHCFHLLLAAWDSYKEQEIRHFTEAKIGVTIDRPESPAQPHTEKKEAVAPSSQWNNAQSEASTDGNSRPWFTDDDMTETDSASTMYSYDVERIRQIASLIRKKGAKKPQRPAKKKLLPRRRTAVVKLQGSKNAKDDDASVKAKPSTKVKFLLPGQEEGSAGHGAKNDKSRTVSDAGTGDTEDTSEVSRQSPSDKRKARSTHRQSGKMSYLQIKDNKLLHTYFRKYVGQCESMEIQNVVQMYALCDAIRFVQVSEVDRRSVLAKEIHRTYLSPTGPKQIAISSEYSQPFIAQLPNPDNEVIEAVQQYILPSLNQAAFNFSLGFGTALKEYKLDLRSDLSQNITKAELALRTLTLKPSSKRRRALGKHSARQPPSEQHKISFVEALQLANEGDLTVELLHFYKYLQGFGSQEGFPLIHNDLLFYVEVSKFLACYHTAFDLVTLKRKVKCILDCFINSDFQPTLQIDVKTGTAERLRRAADNFCNDKGRDSHAVSLFDDAQHTVFNELLPFWAGFSTARLQSKPSENKPVLKSERLQRKRLEAFKKAPEPKMEFPIPRSQPKFDMRGLEFTFSVDGGIQWKEWSDISSSRSNSPVQSGLIEVVKMPPKKQQRRLVRRGNFTIRKITTSHRDLLGAAKQSGENFQQNLTGKRLNYATSVS